jgi:hypothetical protein
MARGFTEVTNDAVVLFQNFCSDFQLTSPRLEGYIVSTRETSRYVLSRFLRFVSKVKVPGYERNALIFDSSMPLEGTKAPDGRQVKAASWLARDLAEPNAPVIRLDVNFIRERVSDDSPYHMLVVNKLILHEIGHVALHWTDLVPRVTGEEYVNSASASQETEAWWFSGAIWAHVMGIVAASGRPAVIDNIWFRS